MIDASNVIAKVDNLSDVSDEEYDSMWGVGVAAAGGQLINQSIKSADVKRSINQSKKCLSINQVKALKLELIADTHLCSQC